MKYRIARAAHALLAGLICLHPAASAQDGPRKAVIDSPEIHELHQVPSHLRFRGEYELAQRSKINAGEQLPTPTAPLRYHVFTDGQEVRLYLAARPGEHSVFQVYQREGIQVLKENGTVSELEPGLQATSGTGKKLRHLCLTRGFLQLTSFPANSDQIELLRATRVSARDPEVKKRLPRLASETLRKVYNAQKMYLADHPHQTVDLLTEIKLSPYMLGGNTPEFRFPTVTDLKGKQRRIVVSQMPPVIEGNYDPSPAPDDGLWDVGE